MLGRFLPILIALLAVTTLLGAAVARYLAYADGDYLIIASVPCDATTGSCFVAECGAEIGSDCDGLPYAKATLLAREAPACIEEHSCTTFSCEGREVCSVISCGDDTVAEGERCMNAGGIDRP